MEGEGRTVIAQAADELRRMWRELVGGLRSTGRDIASEGRAVLSALDAPDEKKPKFFRRGWRHFRQTPLLVQIGVALCLFALWAFFLFNVLTENPAPSPRSPSDTGVSV